MRAMRKRSATFTPSLSAFSTAAFMASTALPHAPAGSTTRSSATARSSSAGFSFSALAALSKAFSSRSSFLRASGGIDARPIDSSASRRALASA